MQFDKESIHSFIIDDIRLKQYVRFQASDPGTIERDLATIVDKLSWAVGDILSAYTEQLKAELARHNIHIEL